MGIRTLRGSTVCLLAVSVTAFAAVAGKSAPRSPDIGYTVVLSFPNSANTEHTGYGSTAALTPPVVLPDHVTTAMLGTNFGGGFTQHQSTQYTTGTVFAFIPANPASSALSPVYEFSQTDGTGPTTGLVQSGGKWYGATLGGGSGLLGTVYSIVTTDGTEAHTTFQSVHSFGVSDTAQQPARGMLVSDAQGNIYGVTTKGGAYKMGTIFKMLPDGTTTALHDFQGGIGDGAYPMDQPVMDSSGTYLYGTTSCGGVAGPNLTASCGGTVYRITLSGTFSVLHAFASPGQGAQPLASPVLSPSGQLMGTTSVGGAGYGVVYKMNIDGTGFSDFWHFAGTDGAFPVGRLLVASNGTTLYGTTSLGGAHAWLFNKGDGTIFQVDAAGTTLTSLYSFGAYEYDLSHPMAGLVQDTAHGLIYGTTDNGGTGFGGGIFSFQTSNVAANGKTRRGSRRRPGRAGNADARARQQRSRRLGKACLKGLGLALAVAAGGARAQSNVDMLEISKAWHLVVADFDHDGHDDIFVDGHDPDDRIWYWTPTGYQPGPVVFDVVDRHACDAADVNNDNMLDLFCMVGDDKGTGDTKANELWIQGPLGVFTRVTGVGLDDSTGRGRIPLFIDVDGDGYPDIYATNEPLNAINNNSFNRYYHNDHNGTFHEVATGATGSFGYDCVAKGDINADGSPDLLVCNHSDNGHIFLNSHNSLIFSELANDATGVWADAKLVDINGDGYSDLIVLTQTGHLQVWLNDQSSRHFVGQATYDYNITKHFAGSPISITVGDFNADSLKNDIYVVMSNSTDVCSTSDITTKDAPDVLFTQTSGTTWSPTGLAQTSFYGCGRLAATVAGNKVLLSNGTLSNIGPSYVLDFGQ